MILTTDPNFWRSVWDDARWRGVKAVAAKRVYLSPHLPFGWFDFPPGANRLLGAWWAGKLLYPQAFADVDLRAKVAEFHRLFYHRAAERSAARGDARRAGRIAENEALVNSRALAYFLAAGALLGLTALAFAVGRYPVSLVGNGLRSSSASR